MKKLTTLIIVFMLMGYPLKVSFTQANKPDSQKVISKKEAELKSKIAANIDTALTNIVNAKTIEVQRKTTPKPKTKYHYKIIHDTLYVDTCINHVVDNYIFERIPDTLIKLKPRTPMKRPSWLYRLFH